MHGVRIDRLGAEDWSRDREIRLRGLADAPAAFAATLAAEQALTSDDWRARLSSEAVTFLAVVAAADVGRVVGAPWHGRDRKAGLFGMWVAPEARGLGIGSKLVRAVIRWAADSGFERLALDVGDGNTAAIALYAKHGFEPTGRVGTLPAPRQHITEHERALVL